jgi:hypothetical protein
MHNNVKKVSFSCPVASVKWPFQYILDKVFQSNGAKLLWVDTYALVTRVLIEGYCCSQWDGLVQGGKI